MKNLNKDIPIQPEIEVDGGYAYCPVCKHSDLEPTDIITKCPECQQVIDWSWMRKFKDKEDK